MPMAMDASERSGIDDMPFFSMIEHARQERIDSVDLSKEIDLKKQSPSCVVCFQYLCSPWYSRVVTKYVQRAKRFLQFVGCSFHSAAIGRVDIKCEHIAGDGLQFFLCDGELFITNIGDSDIHPRAGKDRGHAKTDTCRAAGDKCCLAVQVLHESTRFDWCLSTRRRELLCLCRLRST